MKNEESKRSILVSFLLHLHPQSVNKQALIFTRTFGLGGINALLFVILVTTGLILRFSYVPTPEGAYDSILSLQNNSLFGSLLRNIHHWCAMFMVVTAFLHLLRVFYSQSIYYERKRNWYYGLLLFVVVLAFNFTGYLLPWDQLSYWAVTIMTNIVGYLPLIGETIMNMLRGGETVNSTTLLNFYTLHTALLPLLFVVFMVLHFWLIRKARGVTVKDINDHEMVKVNPELISKEIILALSAIIFIILFSIFFDAPLLEKANPLVSPNPSKAPWYFMGIQELLINLHPIFVTLIIPVSLIALFIFIPTIKFRKDKIGTWFYSQKGSLIVRISVLFSAVLTLLIIITFEYWVHLYKLDIQLIISTGIIPFLAYLLPVLVFIFYLLKALKAHKVEIIISIVTMVFTSYLVMTIIGIWFRGASMQLIF